MAGAVKRIRQISIDWSKLAERVPPEQKPNYIAFKAKSDAYLRRMMANPESPPKIDWAYYKANIPLKAMVDDFQKQYDALKVPYPDDKVTQLVDAQEKEVNKAIAEFKKASDERIVTLTHELKRLQAVLPFEEMTMEDYRDAFPEQAFDPINRPTFWPHAPEDQLDYKPENPTAGESKH